MAKAHGKTGRLFFTPRIRGTGLAFVDGGAGADTITDSGSGFVTAEFKAADIITVSGSTSNDGDYTLVTVAAGTLTLATGVLTAEAAGDDVTIFTALPGQLVAGFYGWNFNETADVVEVTDFVDGASGFKKYIAGLTDWTGGASGYWLTDDFHHSMIGGEFAIQFVGVYDADPTGTTVHFWQGKALVSGIDVDSDVNDALHENLSFQGTGTAQIQGTGIAFVDGGGGADTITDTGSGFIEAGFQEGHKITVSGSTTSDGDYTIVSLVAGTITLATGSLPGNEAAGDVVSISAQIQLIPRVTAWPS